MSEFINKLEKYMDAGIPMVYVDTWEDDRIVGELAEMSRRRNMEAVEWCVRGAVEWNIRDARTLDSVRAGTLPETLDFLLSDIEDSLNNHIVILREVQYYLETPEVISRLKYIAQQINNGSIIDCIIVMIAPLGRIPKELEAYITIMEPDYLSKEDLREKITSICLENGVNVPADALMFRLQMLLAGLSVTEVENILRLAIANDGALDASDIPMMVKQKQQMIKKSGILEMVQAKEKLADIGGLENLKEWLADKNYIFQNIEDAENFGVNIPKGVLIAGMPGCGKSLTAKAAAKTFEMPLLRMDMGRLMGKYVGESEANMRRALRLTEASAPCVLWIDELEKAFAGVGGGGSEVTTRLFGNFLTWMQEKESLAFVVATANNISNLPPELLRKGRFDEIFYVDLPNENERAKIFEIHIKKRRKNDLKNIDVTALAKKTQGYCGADIEGVVRDAVEMAFIQKQEHLTTENVLTAIERTHSLSETMKDNIDKMAKAYREKKFKKASKD